jgi:hypothetical protein
MTQLLIQTSAPDFPTWKTTFDAQAETIAAAGLNTLQIWKGHGGTILALFEVAHRAKAEAWLANQSALGTAITSHFLQTA